MLDGFAEDQEDTRQAAQEMKLNTAKTCCKTPMGAEQNSLPLRAQLEKSSEICQ